MRCALPDSLWITDVNQVDVDDLNQVDVDDVNQKFDVDYLDVDVRKTRSQVRQVSPKIWLEFQA
eukprot:375711-Amorphochlora_amoeboformis.AAC.2